MSKCVYYENSTTLHPSSGVVPDDCNHVVQNRSEYDDRTAIIDSQQITITDLQDQIANGTGTSTVELSTTSIQLLEQTFTDALVTFDPDIIEVLTFAMIAGIVAGWTGGIILNSLRKARR